jgi:hypothetical protein
MQEQRKQQAVLAAQRKERLMQLAASLAPTVSSDPERLLNPTVSSKAQAPAQGLAFPPVHGYTTQQLLADQRFKVLEALGSAGLRGTGYARHAVEALPPVKPVRVDVLTTVQRQAYQAAAYRSGGH